MKNLLNKNIFQYPGFKEFHYAASLDFFGSLGMKIIFFNKNRDISSVISLKFYDNCLLPISKFWNKAEMKYFFLERKILQFFKKDNK